MKLIDLNNKEFSVQVVRPSAKVATEFYKIMDELPINSVEKNQEYSLIISKYIDDLSNGIETATIKALQKAVMNGDISQEQLNEIIKSSQISTEDKIKRNDCYLKAVKIITSLNGLTNDKIELINSDITSDFWQSQDLISLKVEVERFHNLIK